LACFGTFFLENVNPGSDVAQTVRRNLTPNTNPIPLRLTMAAKWEETRDRKRAARDALIPTEFRLPKDHPIWAMRKEIHSDIAVLEKSGLLTDEEKRITSMSASDLAGEIRRGRLLSETVCKVRTLRTRSRRAFWLIVSYIFY